MKFRTPEELFQTQEELHPELQKYIGDTGVLGPVLKHPLVFGVPYTPLMNAMYNEQLKCKQCYLEEATTKGDWSHYIWLHERPYRVEAFLKIKDNLTDEQYWNLLAEIWIDTENQWQYKQWFMHLMTARASGREHLMHDDERELYNQLPDEFMIYRGYTPRYQRNKMGLSWTLSSWKARWFARRYNNKQGKVAVVSVKKANVLAVFKRRGELEVAILPDTLDKIRTIRNLERPNQVALALSMVDPKTHSEHGFWHWDKVERNVIAICKQQPTADLLVCRLFAVLHDSCRENEMEDPLHGQRAADFVLRHAEKLQLTKIQADTLAEACRHHTDGVTSDHPTIGVCWDADRMDLVRVNIIPDRQYFSTQAGKDLLWRV